MKFIPLRDTVLVELITPAPSGIAVPELAAERMRKDIHKAKVVVRDIGPGRRAELTGSIVKIDGLKPGDQVILSGAPFAQKTIKDRHYALVRADFIGAVVEGDDDE